METKTRFTPKMLRALLEEQEFKCSLTQRELTPNTIEAEYKLPLNKGGKHEPENITLVISSVRELKRFHTSEEIYEIAKDIIKVYEKKAKNQKKS